MRYLLMHRIPDYYSRSSGPKFDLVVIFPSRNDGLTIVNACDNTILETRMYEVEYQDRNKESLAVNTIAENMFTQVYGEGNRHVLF